MKIITTNKLLKILFCHDKIFLERGYKSKFMIPDGEIMIEQSYVDCSLVLVDGG